MTGPSSTRPTLAITMGDPAGIGPEIIMKALAHADVQATCRPLVIGDAERLRQAGRIVGSGLTVDSLSAAGEADFDGGGRDAIDSVEGSSGGGGLQLDEVAQGDRAGRRGDVEIADLLVEGTCPIEHVDVGRELGPGAQPEGR